jgi:hypothetical protein
MKVSENGRYIKDDNGGAFFYLADTAWKLFFETSYDEAKRYLANRKEKGFTVIMPVLLCEYKGIHIRDIRTRSGIPPLSDIGNVVPNEDFFGFAEKIIEYGAGLGLAFALLPTWGQFVYNKRGPGYDSVIFDKEKIRRYGKYVSDRFARYPVIWVVGGDLPMVNDEVKEIWRNLAFGVREGRGGDKPITYHPTGFPESSSAHFHNEEWLSFNMHQTSTIHDYENYAMVREDYLKTPAKPVLDGETQYENSHESFSPPMVGRKVNSRQIRRSAYNSILSGACGHTYGCRDVWSFNRPEEGIRGDPLDVSLYWENAMDLEGSWQMGIMRSFFEKYRFNDLVPDFENKIIPHNYVKRGGPGANIPAAMEKNGKYCIAYVPDQMDIVITLSPLKGTKAELKWFNPRTGTFHFIGRCEGPEIRVPAPAYSGEDWILIAESLDCPAGTPR